ncbi:MAG: Rrf2 family transcriptional regulator [Bacteroidetes bacterium]|nr:MAG: Rrf2 family transcriptional regulator [Bacteroidota bacterium]
MPKVINFSDAASIGIHSAILIGRTDKPLNAIQLSEKLGHSKFNIGKVLQRLVKDGIFSSLRGPTGGFFLKKKPEDILIYDIYRSIEGEIEYGACPHEHHLCPLDMCIRDNIIKKMTIDFVNHLKANTLQDYI